MNDIGEQMASAIVAFIILALIVGAILGIGGYFLIDWLIQNLNISWG